MKKFEAGFHGILLAMIMGTGKSLVACMLVLALAAKRVLIICPLRVIPVWVAQFERHVDIPLVIVTLDEDAGTTDGKTKLADEKLKLAQARGVPFVCVINYDSMWREPFATWAEKILWDMVIPDELHRAKSPSGRASTELKRLRGKARYRIGLTGTPMPHGPMDIFAQFRFLDLRIFGPSFTAFRAKYAEMGGYQRKQIVGFQHLEELESLMGRITFRVGKEVLDLPEETTETYYCDLGPEGARVYREMDEDFVARVKDGTIVTAANALVKLVRLQQATGGFLRDGRRVHAPGRYQQAEAAGRHAGGHRPRRAGGGVRAFHRGPRFDPRGVRQRGHRRRLAEGREVAGAIRPPRRDRAVAGWRGAGPGGAD